MYTTTLILTRGWLSDPSNPSFSVQCGTRRQADADYALTGEFREYAGGRIQVVLTDPTEVDSVPVTFAALDASTYQQIVDWRGTLLLFRSFDGERIFGSYLSVSKHRYPFASAGPLFDAAVIFNTVTYNESV